MNYKIATLSIAALTLSLSFNFLTASAQSLSSQMDQKKLKCNLLSKLHHANQAEISMGRLAQQEGYSVEVRNFGAKLVKDHSDADEKVVALAKSRNIDIDEPREPLNAKEKAQADKMKSDMAELQGLSGASFDKKFKDMMVADHKHDIHEVSKAISKLSDSETKDLAQSLLPTLKQHEKISEKLPS